MDNPFRVTLITRSLMTGGTQRHIVKMCQELVREDISISVCLLINDEPRDLVHELPKEIKLFTCPYKRHDIRTILWLANTIRAERSQLVHSFSWHADFYSSLLKILIPDLVVVGSERGDRGAQEFYKPLYNLVDRLFVFRVLDGFCANSNFGKSLLIKRGCSKKRIWVIPNGVNLTALDAEPEIEVKNSYIWPPTKVLCCVVSRLVDYKHLDLFILLIKNCDENIHFVIIGDGPEKANLLTLVKESSLQNRVIFLGQLNPVTPFVKNADICALPTQGESEHCSNSILEYMSCCKPVVAFDVAGNPELVADGVTGFLVAPNHMEEFPKMLDRLAADRELREKMGIAGRKRIEASFQIEDISRQFLFMWRNAFLGYINR